MKNFFRRRCSCTCWREEAQRLHTKADIGEEGTVLCLEDEIRRAQVNKERVAFDVEEAYDIKKGGTLQDMQRSISQ